jgi:predicted component of type VI protein secretion system
MAPPSQTDFSPQTSTRWRAHHGDTQPEQCTQNPHHSEPSGWRKSSRDSMGPVAEVPRSGACDMPLLRPFQAPADTINNTTEELCSIAAPYAVSNKAAQLHPVLELVLDGVGVVRASLLKELLEVVHGWLHLCGST